MFLEIQSRLYLCSQRLNSVIARVYLGAANSEATPGKHLLEPDGVVIVLLDYEYAVRYDHHIYHCQTLLADTECGGKGELKLFIGAALSLTTIHVDAMR